MKTDKFFQNKEVLEKAFIDNNLEPEYTSEDYGWDEGDRLSLMYPGDHDIIIYLYFNGKISIEESYSIPIDFLGTDTDIDIIISLIKARRKRK